MPIKERNNDQNISRVRTKMSEGCSSQKNKPKLTGSPSEFNDLDISINNLEDSFDHSYDHLYATNSNSDDNSLNNNINVENSNGPNRESEVRFLEEWLLLHLDLIQQQNDEITSKERTIYMLQQENEMLREHINCLQRGIPYSPSNYSCSDGITQDAANIEDDKSLIYGCESQSATMNDFIKNSLNCTNLDVLSYETIMDHNRVRAPCDIDSNVATLPNLSNNIDDKSLCTLKESHNSLIKRNKNDFVVNNYQDTLQNFKMSIRRKRLCSGSSAFSNNTSIEDPQSSHKRKKRKSIKDEKILTSDDQYITQACEISSDLDRNEISNASNLEVPRWRVRVYTSCYSMEGTENLDDDVFNRRHMRLENDERRRKRWDVQRIREQRVIEKLKLRQERIEGGRAHDKNKPVTSLWPTLEDVRFIEVADELPVSAFGVPVPRPTPSEFSLPWLNNVEETKLVVLEPEPSQEIQIPIKKLTTGRKPKKRRKATKR